MHSPPWENASKREQRVNRNYWFPLKWLLVWFWDIFTFSFCSAKNWTQGFVHVWQILHQGATAFTSRRYRNSHVVCGLLDRSIGINSILPIPGLGSPDSHSQGSNFWVSNVREGEWGAVQAPTCSKALGFKASKEKTVESLQYLLNFQSQG